MVNENKWGLLYCPRGGWRSNKRWEKIEKVLKQQGVDYDFVQSENQKSVERLIRMFINNGYKTIVIVGGDSALNDAVNCLMQIDPKEREEVALGVIPNGLMNDFAHFWGFSDSDIEKTVASLKNVVSERLTSVVSAMLTRRGRNAVAISSTVSILDSLPPS